MKTKSLLILGAGRYNSLCIKVARDAGYTTIAMDRNPNASGASYAHHFEPVDFSNVAASLKVARKYSIDGVVAMNDYGVRTAAEISEELTLPGISTYAARQATDKEAMRRCWAASGVPSPPFTIVSTFGKLEQAIDEIGFPLIFKPADSRGGGSRGVSMVQSERDVRAAFDYARSIYADRRVVVEKFVYGIEHSAETISYQGETHVLAIGDKVTTPPPYRVNKNILYPTIVNREELQCLETTIIHAVQSLGINIGASHIELCSTKDGPVLFELGARCGGGGIPEPIVPHVTGVEMFKEVVRIAVGDDPGDLRPKWNKGCCYNFLMPRPGKLRDVRNIEQAKKTSGVLDMEVFVGPGDTVPVVRHGLDRAGFIIAGGQNRVEAQQTGMCAEAILQFVYNSSR